MVHTTNQQTHFVLVHGACHGTWCWFKLKPLLLAAGHRVSAFDLAASGTDTKAIQQVTTLSDYTKPLLEFMAAIPPEEKDVLVGHNLGGMSIALAMDKYPEKVSVESYLQDRELGKTLIRPSSLFVNDLRNAKPFTKGGFGSVRQVYVVCDEDNAIRKGFQLWMIDNNPVDEVKELKHVDHMPMLCDPKQLISVCLLDIVVQYA